MSYILSIDYKTKAGKHEIFSSGKPLVSINLLPK